LQWSHPADIFGYTTAGAHILFKRDKFSAPQEGRVLNPQAEGASISTNTATAEAHATQLAPFLPSGSEVMMQSPDSPGSIIGATVLRDTADTEWPPVFTVRLPDTRTMTVGHKVFTAISVAGAGLSGASHPQKSPIVPSASAMPPVPAALPGASASSRARSTLAATHVGVGVWLCAIMTHALDEFARAND
jgi:hypothetical protein